MNTYLDQLCERCGSKRRIAKKWKEQIPTFSGTTTVEYTQIICTNQTCQEENEKLLVKESEKREALRVKKEENDTIRKANTLEKALQARKASLKK